jgi:hypothetical protein
MNKALKLIGVGSVAVSVAGAIAYVVKKVKEVDDYKLPDDYEPTDDVVYHTEDDFAENSEDFSFDSDDDVFKSSMSDEAFKELTGVDKAEALAFVAGKLEADNEKVGFIIPDAVLADMYNVCKKDTLDLFKMLCGVTREEAISELIAYDSDMYKAEELSKLEDKELCQFYADYKVERDKAEKEATKEETEETTQG